MSNYFVGFVLLFAICSGNIDYSSNQSFETCDGNIDVNKPYRIVVDAHDKGDIDKLLFQQFEIPLSGNDLDANNVLIEVKAIGINYIDTYHRNGLYPGVTNIGLEGSGIIKMVGKNVTKYNVNDKVFWFGIQGSYTTHLIVDENTLSLNKFTSDMAQIINQNTDIDENIYNVGASIGIQVLTAHYLSHSIANINSNTCILIHSGAGGTGNILIQIIKNIFNSNLVITTVGNKNKYDIAKSAGADEVIIGYDNFYDKVMELTNGKGVDIVYDGVGRDTWKKSLKCVKQRGWIIYFGNASGKIPKMDILELTKQGSISLIRPSLRHYVKSEEEMKNRYDDIFEWIKNKKLNIIIAHEFRLQHVKQAHQMLESRQTVNKILLIP